MTTNAVLLRPFVRPLKEAGLKRINISLDTLDPEKFRHITRRDRFNDVWAGIEESLNVGLSPVKINVVTINGTNHTEVLDFAILTQRLPITVRFIEYMPTGCDQWNADLVVAASKIKEVIEQEFGPLVPVDHKNQRGPAICYRFANAPGEIGFINPVSSHFCDTCNRIRLTPDGHLRACLFSDKEIDLKPYLREEPNDQVILDMLNQTLADKPMQHHLETVQFKKCQRTMSAIGG
jgi:cyclic pyranopterin phosphate synthase